MDNIKLNPKNYNYHDNYVDNVKVRRKNLLIKTLYILAGVTGAAYLLGFFIFDDTQYEPYSKIGKFLAFVFGGVAYGLGKKQNKEIIDKTVRQYRDSKMK